MKKTDDCDYNPNKYSCYSKTTHEEVMKTYEVQISRLKKLAKEAIDDYNNNFSLGGEVAYPQWANDILEIFGENNHHA